MKVVKLNRRYKMYELGFTHALRWDRWDLDGIRPYEMALSRSYGSPSFYYPRTNWTSTFGSGVDKKSGYKPYFIYVRNEQMLTVALLGADV